MRAPIRVVLPHGLLGADFSAEAGRQKPDAASGILRRMAVDPARKRKLIRPAISILGAGSLSSTLALALYRAGYRVESVVARDNPASLVRAKRLATKIGSRVTTVDAGPVWAEIIWLCVPDAAISEVAQSLAKNSGSQKTNWKGKVALHSSGALSSDELSALLQLGASVASVHPLMTFVKGSQPALTGVSFAIEGDAAAVRTARRIVGDLGGQAFSIHKKDKAAYHAWGMFVSPLLTALLATSERVAASAGVPAKDARRRMLPIITQTVANYAALGAPAGFSGPIVRGDAEVVRRHLLALRAVPEARDVYVALARAAVKYLPVKRKDAMKELLSGAKDR
jgi:predicted short-subunit dehydrogenase-like oxidoreductase (DUF2520 family)